MSRAEDVLRMLDELPRRLGPNGKQAIAALRRVCTDHAPGDEPRTPLGEDEDEWSDYYEAHYTWQERTAIIAAILEELQR